MTTTTAALSPIAHEIDVARRAALGGVRVATRDELAFFLAVRWCVGCDVVSWSPITGGQLHTPTKSQPHQAGKNNAPLAAEAEPVAFLAEKLMKWVVESGARRPFIFCLVGCDAALTDQVEDGAHIARRALIEACRVARTLESLIVLVGRDSELPGDLLDELSLIRHELPTREEARPHIEAMLKDNGVGDWLKDSAMVEALLDAGQGMTLQRQLDAIGIASNKAVDERRRFSPRDIMAFKERQLDGALQSRAPRSSMDDLVGYKNLKDWLLVARTCLDARARAAGIAAPRGVLLAGPPGTGKTRLAEATASFFRVPYVAFDIGAVFSSYIGDSERQMRESLAVVGRMAPCVLHVDEVDTAFSARSGDDHDGGTSKRVLGSFLRWLSDGNSGVFVVMTSNQPHMLDPALIRRGRLDASFFVDLPTKEELKGIWDFYLRRAKAPMASDLLDRLVEASHLYSPGEIEGVVDDAVRVAFANNAGAPGLNEVMAELVRTVPVARSMEERVAKMRDWSREFARPASTPELRGLA